MRMSTKALVQKVLLVLFSAFLIWQSIELVSNIARRTNSTTLGEVATQSILLNLFITGIFLVGYALPLNKLFPDSYYKSVESQWFAVICNLLQIKLFRKVMRLTFWNPRNSKKHFFSGTRNGLAQFESNTRISESSHTLAFICCLAVSFYLGFVGNARLAIIAMLVNVIVNFYPAVLQRYHRLRLQTMIHKHTGQQNESNVGRLTRRPG